MSWETRYILGNIDAPPFYREWEVHFQLEDYSGGVDYILGTEAPVKLVYEALDIWAFNSIIASHLEIEVVELTDDQYIELFEYDRKAKVVLYRAGVIYWQGWSIAEAYRTSYNRSPKTVSLTAIDGIAFLKKIQLNVNTSEIDEPGIYMLRKFIHQIVTVIGLDTAVYESLDIYDIRMIPTHSPLEETHLDTWLFYKTDGTYQDLHEVLNTILTVFGARFYQKNGHWYIDRIEQLKAGEITYRVWNVAFTSYTGTTEILALPITLGTGLPGMNVPVELTLFKELERPFSEFKLTSNYDLHSNMLRYPERFTVDGHVDYSIINKLNKLPDFQDIWQLQISDIDKNETRLEGIVYDLGRVDFTDINSSQLWWGLTDIPQFELNLHAYIKGWFTIRLYLENEADGKRYYYQYHPLASTSIKHNLWEEFIPSSTLIYSDRVETYGESVTGYVGRNCLGVFLGENPNTAKEYNVTIPVYVPNHSILKGILYLIMNTPYFGTSTKAKAMIDLGQLEFNCLQAKRKNDVKTFSNAEHPTNTKELEIKIYSEPLYYLLNWNFIGTANGRVTQIEIFYTNPQFSYPGMLYYSDETHYLPCRYFVVGGSSEQFRLEDLLMQDIMSLYANLRWKVTGRLLGEFDIGSVLDYKGRRYMIVSLMHDLHTAQIEVTLLQIAEQAVVLGGESSGEIVTGESSGEYIEV